jgi:hypothetical protein
MNDYVNTFIEILGEPTSIISLENYIRFVTNNSVIKEQTKEYCEDHHILPNCLIQNDDVYTLTYINHVKAHVLLVEAYPISKFIRPLNFMLSREEKEGIEYRKLLSLSIKENWKQFKQTKQYEAWKEKRSLACKIHMLNGHAKYMSNQSNTEELKKIKSEKMKQYWTEEKRKEKSKSLIEYNKIHGTERYSAALLNRYSSMTDKEYNEFVITMNKVNKDEEKRKKASEKLKEKWKDPAYIEKMKNRKTGDKDKKSAALKERWADPIWKQNMLEKRRKNKHEAN